MLVAAQREAHDIGPEQLSLATSLSSLTIT